VSASHREEYARLSAARPRPALTDTPVGTVTTRFTRQGGTVARLAARKRVPAYVAEHFTPGNGGPLEVVVAADAGLGKLPWPDSVLLREAPANERPIAPLGISWAFAAIAETGSLAVFSAPGAPLALNFLPERLVVLVRRTALVANLEDFWALSRERFGTALPRALCLVSGPSSSGDIGLQFATGVHGPVEVHALLLP